MILEDEIERNRDRFIELLRGTGRDGIEELITYIDNNNFFTDPASTRYHGSYRGGLCEHCLSVYDNLEKLRAAFDVDIDEETVRISALLHDLAKVKQYVPTIFNKKVYSPNGSKSDELGRFDWVSTPGYATADEEDRIIYSNHEATSEFIARQFIDLTIEESVAILHHHGSLGWDSMPKEAMNPVFNKYPLAVLLHLADMVSAHINKT